MKERKDSLDLKEKLNKLEQEMYKGNVEYDSLRKRLNKIGKNDLKITKTNYWHWLVEKNDFPQQYFYATPPIGEAQQLNRILITGTKVETRDMYDILKGLETYQRVMKELQGKNQRSSEETKFLPENQEGQTGSGLILATRSLEEYGVAPKYDFCGRVGSFWPIFFDEEYFLDNLEKISIPRAIIGTGFMRNYDACGGETRFVGDRLEKIAQEWDIPIQFIDSWAP